MLTKFQLDAVCCSTFRFDDEMMYARESRMYTLHVYISFIVSFYFYVLITTLYHMHIYYILCKLSQQRITKRAKNILFPSMFIL